MPDDALDGTGPRPAVDADYFDRWYADMAHSPAKDQLAGRLLGLPAELESTSLLTWDGLGEVVDALALSEGDRLLDLACGRGGYGMEIARRTGADLVGVDFSAEAVRRARSRIDVLGVAERADFRVGSLTRTGLDAASFTAVLCVDAIQFAAPPVAAATECRRVLMPGGRLVLTCWEPRAADDEQLPDRLRHLDLRSVLQEAGFTGVVVSERPAWREAERRYWEAATALHPGDDPALRSLHDEGVGALRLFDRLRRVVATAAAP
jgi:SAM-dependent methyltransferase